MDTVEDIIGRPDLISNRVRSVSSVFLCILCVLCVVSALTRSLSDESDDGPLRVDIRRCLGRRIFARQF